MKIVSTCWINPIDLNEDSGYENPVFIKWINELTPWELLIFPYGIEKDQNSNKKNGNAVSVFLGTIQSIRRTIIVKIELRQNKISIKRKARHVFLDNTNIPGFVNFCSSSCFNFNQPIQCFLSVTYID